MSRYGQRAINVPWRTGTGGLRKAALAALTCAALIAQNVGVGAAVAAEDAPAPGSVRRHANSDIYGRWRVVKVLGAADIAAMSDKEARTLIGKTLDIGKDAFVFNGERCEAPAYERVKEDLVKSFREQGHASAAHMGLPDPVTSIDAGCTHIFLKRPGVIVLHWDGFYFDAVRQSR